MSVNKVNKTTGDLSLLAGGTLYADSPIGSIIPYGGATAPAGWFICDGTELVRATYPELFAVIGTSFGTPSDNTKFKLPDLREATTKGVGLTGKSNNHMDADGLALGEFIDDRVQEHTHYAKFTDERGFLAAKGSAYGITERDPVGQFTGINADGRHGNTTEVKAVGVNYIIKAASVGVPADFMSAVDKAVDSALATTIKPITNSSSFQSNDLIGAKLVGITCYLYNSPGGYFKTTNIIVNISNQCLTTTNPIANERGVRQVSFDNSTGTLTFGAGHSIENGTVSEDNNWCYPISYFVLSY